MSASGRAAAVANMPRRRHPVRYTRPPRGSGGATRERAAASEPLAPTRRQERAQHARRAPWLGLQPERVRPPAVASRPVDTDDRRAHHAGICLSLIGSRHGGMRNFAAARCSPDRLRANGGRLRISPGDPGADAHLVWHRVVQNTPLHRPPTPQKLQARLRWDKRRSSTSTGVRRETRRLAERARWKSSNPVVATGSAHSRGTPIRAKHNMPIGEPWVPGSTCDHLLISLPYLHGPDLEHCTLPGGHARIL